MLSRKKCIFNKPLDEGVSGILSLLGNGNVKAKEIDVGVYEINNFNGDAYIACPYDEYPNLINLSPYGVCDHYKQVIENEPLLSDEIYDREFVVFITPVKKSDQPESGGWRWHKWGPYIGDYEPQAEYLYDEPEIEQVYVYHIYEILD